MPPGLLMLIRYKNAAHGFDSSCGLIHVVGNFAMTARFSDLLGDQKSAEAGAYDAVLVVDPQGVKVLQIGKK